MNNVKYSYSSVQINLPESLSKRIISWGKRAIPDREIFKDVKNPSFGRENEIHVTVLYGIHGDNSSGSRKIVKDFAPFKATLGAIDVFDTNPQFDVVMVKVNCPKLHELNKKFTANLSYTNKYPIYKPHVTIAYVKKGEGKKYKNKKEFEGETFDVNSIKFSSRKGYKETIRFNEHLSSFKNFLECFDLPKGMLLC